MGQVRCNGGMGKYMLEACYPLLFLYRFGTSPFFLRRREANGKLALTERDVSGYFNAAVSNWD